jgi:hypothetical protein
MRRSRDTPLPLLPGDVIAACCVGTVFQNCCVTSSRLRGNLLPVGYLATLCCVIHNRLTCQNILYDGQWDVGIQRKLKMTVEVKELILFQSDVIYITEIVCLML